MFTRPSPLLVVATALMMTLASQPAFADPVLRRSIDNAATRFAQAASRPAARGENPYMVPGLVLISGGGVLTLYAFLSPSGVECSDTSTRNTFSVECGTKANKGLLFTGLGAAGVGVLLLMKGEKHRNASPSIVAVPGGAAVLHRIQF